MVESTRSILGEDCLVCPGNVPQGLGCHGPSWDEGNSHKWFDQSQTRHRSIGRLYNALESLSVGLGWAPLETVQFQDCWRVKTWICT